MENRGRVVSSVAIIVALIAGVIVYVATSGGDESPDKADTTFLARVGSVGPDAFSTSFATAAAEGPFTIESGEIASNSDNLYVVPGRTYGGSGANVCDPEGMKEFFALHPDRARAWARTQQIGMSEIPAFLDSLTPLILAQNVAVTMFGFRGGSAYGYPAIIEAGTAVLVDTDGMPRARCACGNPLIASKDPAKTARDENKRLRDELTQDITETPAETTTAEAPTTAASPTTEVGGETTTTGPSDVTTTLVSETTIVSDTAVDAPTTTAPSDTTILECPPDGAVAYGEVVADANGDLWVREDTAYWPLGHSQKPVASLAELPGYQNNCVPCIDTGIGRDGVVYFAPDGARWTSEFSAAGTIYWRSEAASLTTAELMKNNPECNPCPPIDAVSGTTYTDTDGTVWELKDGRWYKQSSGTSVSYLSDIPGYRDACDPCVNESATYQRDAAGLPLTPVIPENSPAALGTVVIDPAGAPSPAELPDERVLEWTPSSDDCTFPCPPLTTATGDRYVDANGQLWEYRDSMWENTVTGARRSLLRDLPGWTTDCNPCPPKEGAADGTTYVDQDGELWTFTEGRWTNEQGESRTYASDLKGWEQNCDLPPCPPLTPVLSGSQLKDADGVIWTYEHNAWTSTTGERRYNLRDFPGCDPCPPAESSQWIDGMVYIDPDLLPWFFEDGYWSGPGDARVNRIDELPGCGTTPVPGGDTTTDDASTDGTTDTTAAPVATTSTVSATTIAVATTSAALPTTTAVVPNVTTTTAKPTATTAKPTATTVKPTTTTTAPNKAPFVKVEACSGLGEDRPILTITASDNDGGINASGFAAFAAAPNGSSTRNTPASAFSAVPGVPNQYTVRLGAPDGSWFELVGTVTARDTKGLGSTVGFQISASPKAGYRTCP